VKHAAAPLSRAWNAAPVVTMATTAARALDLDDNSIGAGESIRCFAGGLRTPFHRQQRYRVQQVQQSCQGLFTRLPIRQASA
jgi:hypothetical protein